MPRPSRFDTPIRPDGAVLTYGSYAPSVTGLPPGTGGNGTNTESGQSVDGAILELPFPVIFAKTTGIPVSSFALLIRALAVAQDTDIGPASLFTRVITRISADNSHATIISQNVLNSFVAEGTSWTLSVVAPGGSDKNIYVKLDPGGDTSTINVLVWFEWIQLPQPNF